MLTLLQASINLSMSEQRGPVVKVNSTHAGSLGSIPIKTRWGITSVSFGLTCHFPDLHHIHENSAETLGLKYSIVNLLINTKI